MKTLKFDSDLKELIIDGIKTSTWRIGDDKDIQIDDKLLFIDYKTNKEFYKAVVVSVKTIRIKDMKCCDFSGHERYTDIGHMFAMFRHYYGKYVKWNTIIKIIRYKKLLKRRK